VNRPSSRAPHAKSRPPSLSVCLVLNERGWILEKMARRLAECLPRWNVRATISTRPSEAVDVNHWMIYYDLKAESSARTSLAITHVDRPAKLHVLKQRLRHADVGICMSRMTMDQLARSGIPREKLCYILPAHDGDVRARRIVLGLTTQIRPDRAKREHVLVKCARSMRLDAFHFSIIGPRWEPIIPMLEASGATVDYSPGAGDNTRHRAMVLRRLATFDYYLYMGWDEGSMGLLDALAAGIPTIVTPQGFHLDIEDGITYPITDADDLCAVLAGLARERQGRIKGVARLTWDQYARNHALVWRALVNHRTSDWNALLHKDESEAPRSLSAGGGRGPRVGMLTYLQGGFRPILTDVYLMFRFYAAGLLRVVGLGRPGKRTTETVG